MGARDSVGGAPVRLTRRGRLVFVALLVVLGGGVSAVAASASGAGAPESAATVVGSGDTLWTVAERHAPGSDPVATVEQIRRLNRLDGYTVYAGQRLVLPRR